MESAVQDNIPMEARLLDIAYRRQPFALLAGFAASIQSGVALCAVFLLCGLALVSHAVWAADPASLTIDAWRNEVAAARQLAENDVPRFHREAADFRRSGPSTSSGQASAAKGSRYAQVDGCRELKEAGL